MRAGEGKLGLTSHSQLLEKGESPCVQRVVGRALGAADKTDNSGRVVAHAMLHIEGHILLSITGYHSSSRPMSEAGG